MTDLKKQIEEILNKNMMEPDEIEDAMPEILALFEKRDRELIDKIENNIKFLYEHNDPSTRRDEIIETLSEVLELIKS